MSSNTSLSNARTTQIRGRALPGPHQQLRHRFRSCKQTIGQTRVIRATKKFSKFGWYGKEIEGKKIVLHKGFFRAALHCWIHIIPLSATATLAFLNLNGLFIGAQLQGLNGSVCQTLDVLCLQVTAKLIVIRSLLSPISFSDFLLTRSY